MQCVLWDQRAQCSLGVERPHLWGHASEKSLGAAETSRGAADKCHHTLSPWVIRTEGATV